MATSDLIASNAMRVVIGLGASGVSAVRYLRAEGLPCVVFDTREQPAGLDAFREAFPDVAVHTGALNPEVLASAAELIVSPGVSVKTPEIRAAAEAGVPVIGDVELFARAIKGMPLDLVAITGSNAKSTVTTLLGDMAKAAGRNVVIGGNIGVPVLDLLPLEGVDTVVLELSSFQLETTYSLEATAATILNISEDHMDRYDSLAEYHQAKLRIVRGAHRVLVNRDDALTQPPMAQGVEYRSFGGGNPDLKQYGTIDIDGEKWLAKGPRALMPVTELGTVGSHNVLNALSAFALGDMIGLEEEPMLETLRVFHGLAHRCEKVAEFAGLYFVNDSKGTNVGATLAAVEGLGEDHNVVLLAGGVGKGADFSPLREGAPSLRALVTFGQDGPVIAQAFGNSCESYAVQDMAEALAKAVEVAQPGDFVLLSPACASFDQYRNFEVRGEHFRSLVKALEQQHDASGEVANA
ncbi:UDP-N-acetylmuramoyl-L-alanine--D-glutamate ligase [Biformimicrobium ophioploci]|uniref:UDP-N-acetylmuramoylalanine--D-glutamate ligase n=1 Tax=Biformimicrobium ophioploci TaxID=3036711 RepID=A0ABQ6LX60_9GAMM|nr:UDP-N-acetylmuramoyl-L-alanine--D-glutamate ligase [Microbulbifer sp. NKW57]GMG86646.1 UDP-N-acetylmuramoyl-L-alanine--D-glutamate ligase [Microbulbifer sp. NKW57]